MKPKAVLAYCREKGIRAFDLRYLDLVGEWRHVSFPIGSLSESIFEDGIGQEVVLDPQASEHPYSILLPDSEANYLDPFTEQPTLVLAASVQDVVQRQESSFDSRYVVAQALRYIQTSAIADDVQVRTSLRFHDAYIDSYGRSETLGVSEMDRQFLIRSQIVNHASDAGLNIDRHLKSSDGSSEVVLKTTSLREACDDATMLRYLIANSIRNVSGSYGMGQCWASSQWSLIRNGQSIFSDSTYHGISELGLFAQGGLLKHSAALSGIYLLSLTDDLSVPFAFQNTGRNPNAKSFCREIRDANSPRDMVVEVSAIPVVANYHLAYAATLMAMADGIFNGLLPDRVQRELSENTLSDELHVWKRDKAREALEDDWEFLNRGDVFSEELIEWIRRRVRGES